MELLWASGRKRKRMKRYQALRSVCSFFCQVMETEIFFREKCVFLLKVKYSNLLFNYSNATAYTPLPLLMEQLILTGGRISLTQTWLPWRRCVLSKAMLRLFERGSRFAVCSFWLRAVGRRGRGADRAVLTRDSTPSEQREVHSTSDRKWNRAGRRPFLLLFCFYLATDSRTVNTDSSLRMVPFWCSV